MSDWEPGAYALTFYTSSTVVEARRRLVDQQARKAFENNAGSRYILSDRLNSKFLSGKKEHSGLFLCYVYNFVKAAGMLVCCDYCTRTCIVAIVVVVIKSANILNRILNISRSAWNVPQYDPNPCAGTWMDVVPRDTVGSANKGASPLFQLRPNINGDNIQLYTCILQIHIKKVYFRNFILHAAFRYQGHA